MSPVDISAIPTEELLQDRNASIADIKFCEKLFTSPDHQERARVNRQIVVKIDDELVRRGVFAL